MCFAGILHGKLEDCFRKYWRDRVKEWVQSINIFGVAIESKYGFILPAYMVIFIVREGYFLR